MSSSNSRSNCGGYPVPTTVKGFSPRKQPPVVTPVVMVVVAIVAIVAVVMAVAKIKVLKEEKEQGQRKIQESNMHL